MRGGGGNSLSSHNMELVWTVSRVPHPLLTYNMPYYFGVFVLNWGQMKHAVDTFLTNSSIKHGLSRIKI